METKDKRAKLQEAGLSVPRSNEDVDKAFDEAVEAGMVQVDPETPAPPAPPAPPAAPPEPTQSTEPVETEKTDEEDYDTPPMPKGEGGEVFTYVGAGTEPPFMIDFMGLQKFVRGTPERVKNEVVLKKIRHNPSFVAGIVSRKVLFANDQAAMARAAEITRNLRAVQAEVDKENRKK